MHQKPLKIFNEFYKTTSANCLEDMIGLADATMILLQNSLSQPELEITLFFAALNCPIKHFIEPVLKFETQIQQFL